jgi:acetyltransferase-like isoleucine patch superfamily enzyme
MTKRQHISYNQILSFGHFFKLFLGSIASFISFPSVLIAFLHKIRGVKIKNIKKVYFSFNVFLDGPFPQQIEIGEDVWLTRNVTILTHFNPPYSLLKYYDGIIVKPVKIGDGVFIGIG